MPQIIEIQDYPIQITVSEVGIRGPSGAPGQGGSGGNISGFAGVFSINGLSGILNFTGAGGITVNNIGPNAIQFSGNNAAVINLSGINNIAISQSGQVYFVSGVNLINTSQTGQFYPASSEQRIRTSIPTGNNSLFINFPSNFSNIPVLFNNIETSGSIGYGFECSGVSISGYTVLFSDVIRESGNVLYTLAKQF